MEAIDYYYNLGNKVFEIDVQMTSDGYFVCSHNIKLPAFKDFMATKIDGRFSPLDLSKLWESLMKYPDMVIILDPKFHDEQSLISFYSAVGHYGNKYNLSGRVIVQVRNQNEIKLCRHRISCDLLYNIFDDSNYTKIAYDCLKFGISLVSLSDWAMSERKDWDVFIANSISIFVFTINLHTRYREVIRAGASGVYSDFIIAHDLIG